MKEIKDRCNTLRDELRELELATRALAFDIGEAAESIPNESPNAKIGEMIAQATLAYRAIEEAGMRLGKTIQYLEGGVSIYRKEGK